MMGEFVIPIKISGDYEYYLLEAHLRPKGERLLSYHESTAVLK